MNLKKQTGVVIPLGALYTKECPAVGDFLALKPFADFCRSSGLSIIQLLPVNDTGTHSSPYSGLSAFALHPMYIRIEALPEFAEALEHDRSFSAAYRSFVKECKYSSRFSYEKVSSGKVELLHRIYNYIEKKIAGKSKTIPASPEFNENFKKLIDNFPKKNPWIIPYAVFKNLKDAHFQASWKEWEDDSRNLSLKLINERWANRTLKSSHNFFVWVQARAAEQFRNSCDYLKSMDIILKGDIPILMNEDSADCWAHPEFFDQEKRAGSPPDGDSPMGQNWGFPTYNWTNLKAENYSWWKERVKCAAQYYSAFRIDHILGFFRIWSVKEGESTAYLGHTLPCSTFTVHDLMKLGFDEGRINWISKPHIPTSLIEDITWNHEEATRILETVCDRVKSEELWNFKKEIQTDSIIWNTKFSDDENRNSRIRDALLNKWRDRSLMEIEDGKYVPVWSYGASSSWKTLSWDEQNKLASFFGRNSEKENVLWKEQALDILKNITEDTNMIPCAEDLGVNLKVLPEVLKELSIMSLKVVRWNRSWDKENQPYQAFEEYPEQSVCSTSVHDSSTIRQWWNDEKDSVRAYLDLCGSPSAEADREFSEEVAEFVMKSTAKTKSAWLINPLQDYLFMDQKYYMKNPQDERINVPGSVNDFNWTYRLPDSVENLSENSKLVSKINETAKIHDSAN